MNQEASATIGTREAIVRGIKQENTRSNQSLIGFFDRNPTFDLGLSDIESYL